MKNLLDKSSEPVQNPIRRVLNHLLRIVCKGVVYATVSVLDAPLARLYLDRAIGGHRHHRDLGRPSAAGSAEGPVGRQPGAVGEQSQADWYRHPQLS